MKGPEPMTQTTAGAFPVRRFVATRISQAIEPDLRAPGAQGMVESVHRSALNVRWGDGLLTIAGEAMGGLPNGILVDPPIALDQIGIVPGMQAECDGIALRVPAASMAVHLAGAARWSPMMPVVRGVSAAAAIERAERAIGLAGAHAPRLGLGSLLGALAGQRSGVGSLGQAAASSLAEVLLALAGGASGRAARAAAPLIGLGPGATPSGDDLLVGLAAGLAATDHPQAGAFAAAAALDARGMTTSLAECYLFHAGRLEFAERVHVVAAAVLSGPEAGLPGAMQSALAWGASSGADLLVGLLVGVQASAPGLPERLRACAEERNVAA